VSDMSKWPLPFICPICHQQVVLGSGIEDHEHAGVKFHIEEEVLLDGMTSRRLIRSTDGEDIQVRAIRVPTYGPRRSKV